ncbi:MAG: tetratricopeptide repeat protein [Candidatus Sumerlaeia bacterium]|nr:tetratricopeptide repeat protein [Candidatus Sumerlaeia bacterium]
MHRLRQYGAVLALVLGTFAPLAQADEAAWFGHVERGRELLEAGDTAEARRSFEAAEREAAALFAVTDPRAVETLRLLAEANRRMDRIVVAEDFHKQILGVLALEMGESNPATISQHVEMGRFYSRVSNFPKAGEHYAKAFAAHRAEPAAFDDAAAVAYEYAIVLYRLREFARAEEVLAAALPAAEERHGREALAVAVLLRARGEVQVALQKDDVAEPYLRRSRDIYRQLDVMEDPAVEALDRRLGEIATRKQAAATRAEAIAVAQQERESRTAPALATPAADWTVFASEEGWKTLRTFHGTTPVATEPLRVEATRWRLVWNAHPTGDPRFSSLGISIFRDSDMFPVEHLDIEGAARDSAEFRGPGLFHFRINTANTTFQVAVQESTRAPEPTATPAVAEATPGAPGIDQKALEDLLNSYAIRYRTASSDLQKSALRARRARDLTELIAEAPVVNGWVGTVRARTAAADGQTHFSVQLDGARRVVFSTHREAAMDESARTLVPAGTPLAAALAGLREGDRVRFSGVLVPSPLGADGVEVLSASDADAMTAPEFLMRFRVVQRMP